LQYAFERLSFGPQGADNTANKPSALFAQKIIPLRQKILKKFEEIDNARTTRINLQSWSAFAAKFWTFSGDFKDLYKHNSLQHKRQDKQLVEEVEKLINKFYQGDRR